MGINTEDANWEVQHRLQIANELMEQVVKTSIQALRSKKVELMGLRKQDEEKYDKALKRRAIYDDDLEQLKQIGTVVESEYKDSRLSALSEEERANEELELMNFLKEKNRILERFDLYDRVVENLRIDNEKADFLIESMGKLEDELLGLFAKEHQIDGQKIEVVLNSVQKLIQDDEWRREEREQIIRRLRDTALKPE